MKIEQRYKQFSIFALLIAVFYAVFMRLPNEYVVEDQQLKLWARIAYGLMSPFFIASLVLGIIGIVFCLRAKKEKRPVGGLIWATIQYSSGVLLFGGLFVWWVVSGLFKLG